MVQDMKKGSSMGHTYVRRHGGRPCSFQTRRDGQTQYHASGQTGQIGVAVRRCVAHAVYTNE